jgi:hypothetical protein
MAAAVLDRKLIVNCSNGGRPTRAREDRKLYTVEIGDPSLGVGFSTADVFMPPGTGEINWGSEFPQQMVKCDISNFSGISLFRVSFDYTIQWQEVLKTENGTTSGKVIHQATAKSPQFDIGAGDHNSEYFYLMNISQYFVILRLPDSVTIYTSYSDEPRTVKLIPSSSYPPFGHLPPWQRSTQNPPASAPPSPAPRDTPKEK